MRRSSSSPSMQLFPFLAVLVCAMGALILLLLVTTRKMRQVAEARAAAEAEQPPPIIIPAPPQPSSPEVAPSGPTREELAALQAERKARRAANAAARRRQAEREAKWQRQVAEAEIARDQRRQLVEESTTELDNLRQRLQVTESSLSKLRDKKSKLKELQEHDAKWLAQAEREHEKLTAAIAAAQKKLADLRRAHAESASKYAFIPYDGASGTTRRPIYIECTSTGIRFQPENELLDESDLKGFTETFNPLLLASEHLMQYWREQSALTDDPRKPMRPYVLLVVRPKGTISYYVARKMLSQLGDDFGYELLEDDFPLQLPPADPEAKLVIRRAVAEALKNRGEMLAIGGRVGEARLGQVLMGRNEELIEFGTLDDQVAATVANQESPFAKNSPGVGKSFSVTRSPIGEQEMASKSYKTALEEQQRRQARGVPNHLGTVGEHVSAPETNVPGSLAEMTQRPGGTGPASLQPNSPDANSSTIRPNDPRTYALSDPFSREQLATGRQGAGSVAESDSRGEQAAGNLATNAPSGRTAANRGGSRNQPGFPQGSRPGKVIEIAPEASPISDADAGDSNGTANARTTGQRNGREQAPAPRAASLEGSSSDPTSGNSPTETNAGQRQPGSTPPPMQGTSPNGTGNIPDIAPVPSSAVLDRGTRARQNSGTQARSTDPNAAKNRIYGDNPEARKQLAASKSVSKTVSTMQKHDAARRRWGGANTGQIGFERKVSVQVMADKIVIGKNEIEVVVEPGTTQDELVESVLEGLDEYSQSWGKPPTRFYWVPYLDFEVYAGGHGNYERLHGALREWGIFSESKSKPGERPTPATTKEGLVQPVSEASVKPIGPEEPQTAPPKKSGMNWFKRITQGPFKFSNTNGTAD